ncbi:hypothetical protein ACS0TY_031518 [Phlomoides rotata]
MHQSLSLINSSLSRNIMNTLLLLSLTFHSFLTTTLSSNSPCKKTCGSLEVKYPFGTGEGCGSPRFHPYVACSGGRLLLTTHKGTYTITSINYASAVISVAPPCMSNCTSMQPSPITFGLDWASPFQLGPSSFILFGCSSTQNSICDPSYLCASFYSCPAVVELGLPTNSCCVYSPANLDPNNQLDLGELKCAGYSSVAELGDVPTDPARWRYGVALKYTLGVYETAPSCRGCEESGGVCGYGPPRNSFVCVCDQYGNTTTDCNSYNWIYMSSSSLRSNAKSWLEILGVSVLVLVI